MILINLSRYRAGRIKTVIAIPTMKKGNNRLLCMTRTISPDTRMPSQELLVKEKKRASAVMTEAAMAAIRVLPLTSFAVARAKRIEQSNSMTPPNVIAFEKEPDVRPSVPSPLPRIKIAIPYSADPHAEMNKVSAVSAGRDDEIYDPDEQVVSQVPESPAEFAGKKHGDDRNRHEEE